MKRAVTLDKPQIGVLSGSILFCVIAGSIVALGYPTLLALLASLILFSLCLLVWSICIKKNLKSAVGSLFLCMVLFVLFWGYLNNQGNQQRWDSGAPGVLSN